MRKWILLLLIAVLAVQLLPAGANAAAAAGELTAKIDQNDRTVVIAGRLPEAGGEVLVTVTDPDGRMDYFNQKKTDEAGGFRFSYVSRSEMKGTYRVRAIGSSAGGGAPWKPNIRIRAPRRRAAAIRARMPRQARAPFKWRPRLTDRLC